MTFCYQITTHGISFPDVQTIERILGVCCSDWLRYSNNSWIAFSNFDSLTLANSLKPVLQPTQQVLIFSINPLQAQGFSQKWIWDWLNKPR